MTRQTDGAVMLLMGLMILTIPGLIYNNLTNSGLANNSSTMVCDQTLGSCVLSTTVGCQANAANCQLSGQTISFLNSKSPFTQLLQGNLFALFTNLNPLGGSSSSGSQTSWSGTHGPFDITGNPIYYSADCQFTRVGGGSQANTAPTVCTATNTDGSNMTKANAPTWTNWNTNWATSTQLIFFSSDLGNATYARNCAWIAQINYTLLANGPGFTYYGCEVNQGASQGIGTQPTATHWAYLVAMPVSYGPVPAGTNQHVKVFVQLESFYVEDCVQNVQMGWYASTGCNNFLSGFKGISIPGTNLTFVPNSAGAIVFGFLAGIILLVGGLGLQIGVGGGVSAGTNPQGTKLFQSLGIGLILWGFFSSQFSGWFTSGLLPFGLDGLFGIVALLIDGLIFVGVYLMSQQGSAATTS